MALNAVGTGLNPQATPHQEILGWTDAQVRDFQIQAEWAFDVWSQTADAAGRMPFWMIQYLTIYSMLVYGEYVRIPVMLDTGLRRAFSLALQCIHPSRLATPKDLKLDDLVRDGIKFSPSGAPESYYIYNPSAMRAMIRSGIIPAPTSEYKQVPAWIAHRPGLFHGFIPKTEEQVRGVSVLAPAMKFFRDLSDYLDFELVGAIIAASFAVFIETSNPYDTSGQPLAAGETYKEVNPGQILYGSPGEKPHILAPNRPGDTFPAFVERVLRAVGASCGMPYEIIAKDFSKTNYSSARAALLEAWRVFAFYQKWLVDGFCQPVYDMVIEEAWLRNMIRIPDKTDFYAMRQAICRAAWIPPRRGHVDPTKEIEALVTGLDNHLVTLSEASAEMGGDWETRLRQRAREEAMRKDLGLEKAEKKNKDPQAKSQKSEGETDDQEKTGGQAG
jgi:lambda family phage portal protein